MSTYPSNLEARVSALERRQINTDAHIEELSQSTTTRINHLSNSIKDLSGNLEASFKQLVEYQIGIEHQIDTRFNLIEQRLTQHDQRFDAVDQRFDAVDQRLNKMDTRLGNIETVLTQILARLPEKP